MMKFSIKPLTQILLVICASLVITKVVQAQTLTLNHQVIIYLFWGDGCSHCAEAKPFLEGLAAKYPEVELKSYEVYFNQENQKIFLNIAEKIEIKQLAVPTIIIGSYSTQGYSEELKSEIENVVIRCLQNGCEDAGLGIVGLEAESSATLSGPRQLIESGLCSIDSTISEQSGSCKINPTEALEKPTESYNPILQPYTLEIPFIGNVDLGVQSILLSTVLIAFVDGFNPCSLWVLSMLLALTLHTGSRKKVFAIGLIFLTVTAAIYTLFIAGLFSVLKVTSFLGWIRALVALVALFFALVNIKDYFWYKKGISLTIAEDKKSGIFKRVRSIINVSQSFWGLTSATVVLAAGVSIVEFSCTAGFPIIWANLLNAQNISGAAFVLLLLLYMVIYQLDELIIFFSAVISLKSSRLEEKHGRLLKLIGGMLMLTLSIVMLVNPALMNTIGSSLIVFGLAFLATSIVVLVHQTLLPKLGIRIGTERKP